MTMTTSAAASGGHHHTTHHSASPTPPWEVVTPHSPAVRLLLTKVRDRDTGDGEFKAYADRLMTLLAEEALAHLPSQPTRIVTPTDLPYDGVELVEEDKVCLVSIVRAGDSLMEAARKLMPRAAVGKILIQRDESSAEKRPKLFYSKLPPDVASRPVLLCDPMLATGGSARCALDMLVHKAGVPAGHIVFACVVASPEGIQAVRADYPDVTIVAAEVDDGLNADKYIVPGLGDYGDRYYGTLPSSS